jgi:hypothetical protein
MELCLPDHPGHSVGTARFPSTVLQKPNALPDLAPISMIQMHS